MEVDGISLTMGGAAVSAIAGIAGAWVKAKYGKTTVPQPLETREEPQYVTCDQCRQHRDAIQKRIDDIGPALGRVFKKLDENDKRAEERSIQTHRRLDPIVEEIGRLRGKVELIEKAAMNATMGGTKQ
jgi:hypothetical protein